MHYYSDHRQSLELLTQSISEHLERRSGTSFGAMEDALDAAVRDLHQPAPISESIQNSRLALLSVPHTDFRPALTALIATCHDVVFNDDERMLCFKTLYAAQQVLDNDSSHFFARERYQQIMGAPMELISKTFMSAALQFRDQRVALGFNQRIGVHQYLRTLPHAPDEPDGLVTVYMHPLGPVCVFHDVQMMFLLPRANDAFHHDLAYKQIDLTGATNYLDLRFVRQPA